MAFKSFFSKKSKQGSDIPDAELVIDMSPQNIDKQPTALASAFSLIAILISLAAFFVAGMGYLRGLDSGAKTQAAALASQVAEINNRLSDLNDNYLTLSVELDRLKTIETALKETLPDLNSRINAAAALGDDIAAINDRLTIFENNVADLKESFSTISTPLTETLPPETLATETEIPPETETTPEIPPETGSPETGWLSRLFGDFSLTPTDNNAASQEEN